MAWEETLDKVVERLRDAAPQATIILFGSHARGDAGERSDLDVLVVEWAVESRWQEIVRLDDAVTDLGVAVDVLVISQDTFDELADTPPTVINEAVNEEESFMLRHS